MRLSSYTSASNEVDCALVAMGPSVLSDDDHGADGKVRLSKNQLPPPRLPFVWPDS